MLSSHIRTYPYIVAEEMMLIGRLTSLSSGSFTEERNDPLSGVLFRCFLLVPTDRVSRIAGKYCSILLKNTKKTIRGRQLVEH